MLDRPARQPDDRLGSRRHRRPHQQFGIYADRSGADGVLAFHGSPKGAPAVAFKATDATARQITFVNPAHDYPQRVRYVATADGIDAEVSLADGSKPQWWLYRRAGSSPKRTAGGHTDYVRFRPLADPPLLTQSGHRKARLTR